MKKIKYVIEDDYDSELRYFGRPVPALQGLRENANVVYLGSFSSTLFSSIKISYMVLPSSMVNIFKSIRDDYTQTCSEADKRDVSSLETYTNRNLFQYLFLLLAKNISYAFGHPE